ncbi:hypothetical protein F511_09062 [Dorcoceras hygrometricum]|uniref:Uncharacterized protein n=1 Tax=Dorcoceras hygrometricum TaxID=472368 RepID=A0A2Z7DFC1_9LAMI|nr:hypothetical protein F511_09062 [Dorcoceras hygrometricum]
MRIRPPEFETSIYDANHTAGSLVISSADYSNDIVSLHTYLKDLATGFLSCDLFLFVATGAVHSADVHLFYEIVTTQVLLAEPLGSLAFKMVQVRQLVEEQQDPDLPLRQQCGI